MQLFRNYFLPNKKAVTIDITGLQLHLSLYVENFFGIIF